MDQKCPVHSHDSSSLTTSLHGLPSTLPSTLPSHEVTSPSEMSFSIYVDRRDHMKPHRRVIRKWVSDDSVSACYHCSAKFSMFCRKHHCRVCGKVFCYTCLPESVVIPEEMIPDLPSGPSEDDFLVPVRVCQGCSSTVSNFRVFYEHVKKRICDFDLLEMTSHLHDSRTTKSKPTPEINAITYCYNKLREIQYKLPGDSFTSLERDLLKTNKKYFYGHNRWMVQLIKIGQNIYNIPSHLSTISEEASPPVKTSPKTSVTALAETSPKSSHKTSVKTSAIARTTYGCKMTMCSRNCHATLDLPDVLELLSSKEASTTKIIEDAVRRASVDDLVVFLPLICKHITQGVVDILLKRMSTNTYFINQLYWSIKAYHPGESTDCLTQIAKLPIYAKIMKMQHLGKVLHDTSITAGVFEGVTTPVHPDRTYLLDKTKIRPLPSASRPLYVPLLNEESRETEELLFKFDDVRKDHLVMNLMTYVNNVLQKAGIATNVVRYQVFPMSAKTGIIEIVKDAKTIYDIKHSMKFTIQNYINEHNGQRTVKEVTDRFIHSAAIYSIMSYLLGVGDRHLDNIMITKDGLLFHIDFDYILGRDPKINTSKYLKITPEIVNVIGGYNSKRYNEFKQYCIQIYNVIRPHINQFMMLLMIDSSPETVRQQMLERFEVGESTVEAALHIESKIATGTGQWIDNILDWFYSSKKTINSYAS